MAKRKRLGGPNPDFVTEPLSERNSGMFPIGRAAPIADVASDASAIAALDEMVDSVRRAHQEGRMVLTLDLDDIQLDYLVRDRIQIEDQDMQALVASVRKRGQQTPIEVSDLGNGRYGLISGQRRCAALLHLNTEFPDAGFGSVYALLRQPVDAGDAYLAMVEENEIRVGLSYYERARIVSKSTEQGVFETKKKALAHLFGAVSRTKRSKIGTFVNIVDALDRDLKFPDKIGERVGLLLGRAVQEDQNIGATISKALGAKPPTTPEEELNCLKQALTEVKAGGKAQNKANRKGSNKANSHSEIEGSEVDIVSGIELHTHSDGSLTLQGDKVNMELRLALVDWLSHRS